MVVDDVVAVAVVEGGDDEGSTVDSEVLVFSSVAANTKGVDFASGFLSVGS